MKNVSCSRTVTLTSNRLNTYLYRNAPARDPVSRRPARTRPTRAQTRERILDGALEAFAERGFHGSTQEDICERVGLSRGAYNSSFRSKDELFFALYDRVIERLQSRLEEATACALSMPGSTADNFLKAFIASYPFDRDWYLLQAEFGLYALRHPAMASHYAERQGRILVIIEGALADILREDSRIVARGLPRIARLILAVHEGSMFQGLLEPHEVTSGELLDFLVDLMLAGAATSVD